MAINWEEVDKKLQTLRTNTSVDIPVNVSPKQPQQKTGIDWNSLDQKLNALRTQQIQTQEIPSSPSPLQYIKEHPFKSILQPVPVTLGGKSPYEKIMEKFGQKQGGEQWMPAYLRAVVAGITGDVANIATTPSTYIPIPLGKVLGKIPMAGTTLGEIATRIPVSKGFMGKATELGRYEQALKMMSPLSSRGISPVDKITQVLLEAKPIRATQEALYTAERSKRLGQVIEAGQTVPGEQGFFAQKAALKGELPKVQFEGIRGKVGQSDIDGLFQMVQNSSLDEWDKLPAKTGLAKLLGAEGGVVPTEGELNFLSKVFPSDFIQTVLSKRNLTQKLFEGAEEVLNVPRAVMASADMSAPLRQGIFLSSRHPIIATKSFRDMFKYAFSEKAYQGLEKDIASRPTYQLMKESGLSLTNIGTTLSGREERFMSNLAEKIPIGGHIVRGSNRAYTGFLNKLRADVFDNLVSVSQRQGIKLEGKRLTDLSMFINAASGRGKLPGALERSAVALNSVFFSPRLMASRINLLNPVYYYKLDPFVRKEALKSLFAFTGMATTVITLAKMGGADIGYDPRSADFGKIKFGNTRYDILGGFQQYIRFAAQMITGEHISSTTGVKTTVGEGYKPLNRLEIAGRFLQTKEAPVVSFASSLLMGKDPLGKDLDIPVQVTKMFVPMVIQDMYDLVKERGLEGVGMAVPGIFGVGLQTYSPSPTEIVYSTNSVKAHTKELLKQGRIEEAKKLYLRNEKLVSMGEKLEPIQKEMSKYEKAKETIIKNIQITPEQKKRVITYTDMMIQKFGKRMEERYKAIK